jgi:hypothetical protein
MYYYIFENGSNIYSLTPTVDEAGTFSLKAVQELLGHASLAMTMRYAHLSHEHLKDSVNLLNNIPSGKQMVNIGPKIKKASNPEITNLL